MSFINYGDGVIVGAVFVDEEEDHGHTTVDVITAEADNLSVTGPITGTGDLSNIRNLRVAAHAPDPNNQNALLADGLPKGFVFENATGTEQLDMIDDSSILVGTTAAKHTTVRDGSLGVVLNGTNNVWADSAADQAGLAVRADKDQNVAHLSLSRANDDAIFAVGRDYAGSVNECTLSDGVLSVQRGVYTIQLMPSATTLFAVYNGDDPIYQIHSNGQPTHHKALGASHDVLASDDSLYVGSVRFSYDRQNHKIKGEKLKHQIPAQLAAANFTIDDMPAGKVYADLSALDWLNVARDHMNDTSVTASTLFATAGDWDTYYIVDEVMQAQVESLEDDVSVAQGTIISNTSAHTANAVSHAANTVAHTANAVAHAANTVSHAANTVSHTANAVAHAANTVAHAANATAITGKQATLSFVAVSADDSNPSTSSQIKTYVDDAVGSGAYVQYSTPGDEASGNGIGVLNGNGSVAADGYIELDKANGTSYYYACRMNERRMRFTFRFTQTHNAYYMGLVIFNDTITQYTTSKMVIVKKMRDEEVGNPEELGRVLVHRTACSFRNGGVSTTLVNSNVYTMVRMTTTGEGNPDNLDHIVEDHCDNESANFLGYDDNSTRDIQVGTEFYLYVTLSEEE